MDEYNWKNVKARSTCLEAVKGHLVPHVTEKKHAYDMWAALIKLFQGENQNRKMVLRQKLRDTKMTKSKNVASYLTDIT